MLMNFLSVRSERRQCTRLLGGRQRCLRMEKCIRSCHTQTQMGAEWWSTRWHKTCAVPGPLPALVGVCRILANSLFVRHSYLLLDSFNIHHLKCMPVFVYMLPVVVYISPVIVFAASRSSSRASTASGSRPTSRTGFEAPDDTPEVFTTVQSDSRNVGGRSDTTVTYQTHNVQTRNVTLPTTTSTKISRIPKIAPAKKK